MAATTDSPRAVASLTVPGGQEFNFFHFPPQISIIFSQTFLIFFLILALRVGDMPAREGPGYATGFPLQTSLVYLLIDTFWYFYRLESCGARFLALRPRNAALSFALTRTGPKNSTFSYVIGIS